VELCIEAGLVWGEELYFDSTKVQANANINGMIDRTEFEVQQHLGQLFEHSEEDRSDFGKFVAKYNGKRLNGITRLSSFSMTLRKIIMSVLKDNFVP
jgi:hypothetical protein